ncbi:hypothetical protein BJ166DRAFT_514989 [Pestalotiopsis sp. NC0098]|nr:hypothetical protein BJ166DRAFT_514989 [Pestalotiopsis sp. NC0098]
MSVRLVLLLLCIFAAAYLPLSMRNSLRGIRELWKVAGLFVLPSFGSQIVPHCVLTLHFSKSRGFLPVSVVLHPEFSAKNLCYLGKRSKKSKDERKKRKRESACILLHPVSGRQ